MQRAFFEQRRVFASQVTRIRKMSTPLPSVSSKRLEGKVAIITGGASGIGKRAATLFWEHGAKVIIADIQDNIGHAICEQLDCNASYVHCDVTDESQIQKLVDGTMAKYGKLDIMYNNAGIIDSPYGNINTTEKSVLERVLAVNLVGAFLGAKHAARVMIPVQKGCILFTASTAASIAGSASHAYAASKHGLVGLMKSLTAELGQFGIRVNCISPYGIATNIWNKIPIDPVQIEEFLGEAANLKGTTLEVDDVALAALFLASDEAKYVSGLNLVVDGGFSVVNPSVNAVLSQLSKL